MSVTKENDTHLDEAKYIKKMATKVIPLDESKFLSRVPSKIKPNAANSNYSSKIRGNGALWTLFFIY